MTDSSSEPQLAFTESPLRTVGRYEILHKLASGGMATVYLGRMSGIAGFEKLLAIKCCREALRSDEQFVTMFLDEARTGAQIRHPNAIGILDVGDDEELYLVMEYVEGGQLSELTRAERARDSRVPLPIALRIMIDMLAGLQGAHDTRDARGNPLNIIHRDVTPSNIMVGSDGVTRLTDFGIAKAEMRATATLRGVLKGKLGYTAPEQLDPDEVITPRVDVFSAGIVMWEMLTGRGLFRGANEGETVRLVMESKIHAPSAFASDVPLALDGVVLKALSRDPSSRYSSAAEFAERLEGCGIKPASTRDVAAYVEDRLAEKLSQLRALVRELIGEEPVSSVRTSMRPPAPDMSLRIAPVTMQTGQSLPDPSLVQAMPAPVRAHSNKALRWVVGAMGLLLALCFTVIVVLWMKHSDAVRAAGAAAVQQSVQSGSAVTVDAGVVWVAPVAARAVSVASVVDAGVAQQVAREAARVPLVTEDAGDGRHHRHHHRHHRRGEPDLPEE